MATGVQDASGLVYHLYVDAELLQQDVELLVEGELLTAEQPRTAKCGTPYHHGIHTVAVEGCIGLLYGV